MSVLLDTNVVSELIRKARDPAVATWVAGLPLEDLFFSAVGEAELRYGVAILPAGRRRQALLADIEGMLLEAFGDRVLPFDRGGGARVRGHCGGPTCHRALCRARRLSDRCDRSFAGISVATRNVRDFDGIGVDIVNPWTAP